MLMMACGGETPNATEPNTQTTEQSPPTAAEFENLGFRFDCATPCTGRLQCKTWFGVRGPRFPIHACLFPCSAGCPQGTTCRFYPDADGPGGACR